jgi:hypothetical protein
MKIVFASMLTVLFIFGVSYAAPQISISTDKLVYGYGDVLSLSIKVSEVTGDDATFEIVDQYGQSSSPIHVAIVHLVSNVTAPVPFYKTVFSPGAYHINIQYAGSNATTSFQLTDTGKIAIPPQFKFVANSWSKGETSDKLFTQDIEVLIQSGIIKTSNNQQNSTAFIPPWFKNDARWWSDDAISDSDFGLAVQYLVDSKIIRFSLSSTS